jgi:hypothetical protein
LNNLKPDTRYRKNPDSTPGFFGDKFGLCHEKKNKDLERLTILEKEITPR